MIRNCQAACCTALSYAKRLSVQNRPQYTWVLTAILKNETFKKNCRDAGLTKSMVAETFHSFTSQLVLKVDKGNLESLKVHHVMDGISKSKYSPESIFPLFLTHAKRKIPSLQKWGQLKGISDLSDPTQWYPFARGMSRSIVFHAGPTNSGKTHAALKSFLGAKSGVYCCPLRLLAREVATKSRQKHVPCSLITGEERDYAADSKHVACTVEMTNLNTLYNIAVIDEIQILADKDRGWAWTRALLGVQANEVHACGEPRAIAIVKRMAEECGDHFEVLEYERLTKLRVKKHAVGKIEHLRPGDCVVCFKRKDIYNTVEKLKQEGKNAAVVYGKLPPSTKRKEAQKFNSNNCDILVATDAVGMGLNLNIKRIVFNSLEKGVKDEKGQIVNKMLTTPEALQIAGRAGRFGLQESGEVTTLHEKDIDFLHSLLLNPKEDISKAMISPATEHYIRFSREMRSTNLFKVLKKFRELCTIDSSLYELCGNRDSLDIAETLQKLNLPIADAFKFSLCPINVDGQLPVTLFLSFAEHYAQSKKVTYSTVAGLLSFCGAKIPLLPTDRYERLALLEDVHNALGAYLWLTFQFPKNFPDRKKVADLRSSVENVISLSLKNIRNKHSFKNQLENKRKR